MSDEQEDLIENAKKVLAEAEAKRMAAFNAELDALLKKHGYQLRVVADIQAVPTR